MAVEPVQYATDNSVQGYLPPAQSQWCTQNKQVILAGAVLGQDFFLDLAGANQGLGGYTQRVQSSGASFLILQVRLMGALAGIWCRWYGQQSGLCDQMPHQAAGKEDVIFSRFTHRNTDQCLTGNRLRTQNQQQVVHAGLQDLLG